MKNKQSTILVIFGISGDLASRYLLPAIGEIAQAGMVPKEFQIVGVTRDADKSIDSILQKSSEAAYLREHIKMYYMPKQEVEDYKNFNKYLESLEKDFRGQSQRLFYLSVPPEASKAIIELLGESKLSKRKRTKLLLEKPFGVDLKNAKDLVQHIDKYFKTEQVYRVDHYLAKETAQNIIVFRSGNSLFKKTWNKNFIERIEIIGSEALDIEGRVNFYEKTGALRDYLQSHLLQLTALTLMELPENMEEVPKLREKALKQLRIACDINKDDCVKRAQYMGYRKEVRNPNSTVETFVKVVLHSKDPKWRGVPITLATGKALKSKFTEIKIHYRRDKEHESNRLVLRLQPDAGIEFSIWSKVPGYEHMLKRQKLHFIFTEKYQKLPEAYEQVLFNAINSDHSLFTSSGEILETWRILDVVQKNWKRKKSDLKTYKKGTSIEDLMKTE